MKKLEAFINSWSLPIVMYKSLHSKKLKIIFRVNFLIKRHLFTMPSQTLNNFVVNYDYNL